MQYCFSDILKKEQSAQSCSPVRHSPRTPPCPGSKPISGKSNSYTYECETERSRRIRRVWESSHCSVNIVQEAKARAMLPTSSNPDPTSRPESICGNEVFSQERLSDRLSEV